MDTFFGMDQQQLRLSYRAIHGQMIWPQGCSELLLQETPRPPVLSRIKRVEPFDAEERDVVTWTENNFHDICLLTTLL